MIASEKIAMCRSSRSIAIRMFFFHSFASFIRLNFFRSLVRSFVHHPKRCQFEKNLNKQTWLTFYFIFRLCASRKFTYKNGTFDWRILSYKWGGNCFLESLSTLLLATVLYLSLYCVYGLDRFGWTLSFFAHPNRVFWIGCVCISSTSSHIIVSISIYMHIYLCVICSIIREYHINSLICRFHEKKKTTLLSSSITHAQHTLCLSSLLSSWFKRHESTLPKNLSERMIRSDQFGSENKLYSILIKRTPVIHTCTHT